MKIKLAESSRVTKVFFNVRDNEYFVVHDSAFKVIEFSYEDSNYDTNTYYALNRQELRDADVSDVMHENGIFEIPVFEFFTDHNFYINRYMITALEEEGVITVMSENEFEKYAENKSYGDDYRVFDHNSKEIKPTKEFVKNAPPLQNFDRRKAERSREQVRRDLGVDSIYDLRPQQVIQYGLKSKQNYVNVQHMYVLMDTAVRVKENRKRFWKEVARELNFPDNVTIN